MSEIRTVDHRHPLLGLLLRRRRKEVQAVQYRYPPLPLLRFGMDLVLGKKRSLVADSLTVAAFNQYPRRYEGLVNVPRDGPFLLVCNHYARPGLQPYHWGMVITAALAPRRSEQPHIRWVIIGEWQGRRFGPLPIPPTIFRWVFGRVAQVYDLVALPAATSETLKRAAILRRLLELGRQGPVGLVPEGSGSGILKRPPPGSGLLIQALNRVGLPIVPAGIWEDTQGLIVRFGATFDLSIPKPATRREWDRLAQEQVMVAIGRLLPRPYWGEYADAIATAGGA